LVFGGLAVAVPIFALVGWWIMRNFQLYGDWSGNNVVAAMWCCDPIPPLRALYLFLTGLLGRFGQGLMITYPRPYYFVAAGLALVAAVGHLALNRAGLRPQPFGAPAAATPALPSPSLPAARKTAWLTPEVALWLLHLGTFVGVAGALLFYAITVTPGLPGRYMFPAFPSMVLLLAAGWLAWFPQRRRGLGAVVLGGLTAAATLYALFGMVIPTYSMPRTASAGDLRTMTPVDAQFEETALVQGYQISSTAIRPGEMLSIAVFWTPLSRTDVPYTVFLHLFQPALGIIAQRDTFPSGGNYATTIWDVGRDFVDTYTLTLPSDTPARGEAQLILGLYNGETGIRLPVTGQNAAPTNEAYLTLSVVWIAP
jgi:hypothetical protein